MKITILPRAEKELRKLPKLDQIAVASKIRVLSDPPVFGEEKLAGYTHVYRVRVGNYRVVYKRASESIVIILIRHRRDIYRMLKDILG